MGVHRGLELVQAGLVLPSESFAAESQLMAPFDPVQVHRPLGGCAYVFVSAVVGRRRRPRSCGISAIQRRFTHCNHSSLGAGPTACCWAVVVVVILVVSCVSAD